MLPQQPGLTAQALLRPGLVAQELPEPPRLEGSSSAGALLEATPESPQVAAGTLALVAPQGPAPQVDSQALALAAPQAPLPVANAAFTELQVEVETFIASNQIDERAAGSFRGQPPFVVRSVMDLGPLTSSSNPSASLMGRIKKAKEHIENVKQAVAAKVEAFLLEEDGVDERAGAQLRMQDPDVQLVVMDRGTLKTSTNPSASLMGRVKKALEPGGNLSRADIYSMKPGAQSVVAPVSQPAVQSPQVTQMRLASAATLNPTTAVPAQNAMLPIMMAPGALPGYSPALMGQYGAMPGASQLAGGFMGVLGAAPTAAYQQFAALGYPGAMGQASMATAANAVAAVPAFPQALHIQHASAYGLTPTPQLARPAPY